MLICVCVDLCKRVGLPFPPVSPVLGALQVVLEVQIIVHGQQVSSPQPLPVGRRQVGTQPIAAHTRTHA